MKRLFLIGTACALAALPLLPAAAMPRASAQRPVIGSGGAIILAHGDHGHAFDHAFDRTLRMARDRDDAWSRGLRRFRNTFD
jgi:hypothetical protein